MLPFGQALRLWRAHRQLTQAQVAQSAHIPRPNLCAMERGRREVSLTTLRAVALALDITPGTLVDGIAPPTGGSTRLSREAIERVADAVAGGTIPRQPSERRLAALLRAVTMETSVGRRRTQASSWLQLNAAYPPALVRTLLDRIAVRQRMHAHEPRAN